MSVPGRPLSEFPIDNGDADDQEYASSLQADEELAQFSTGIKNNDAMGEARRNIALSYAVHLNTGNVENYLHAAKRIEDYLLQGTNNSSPELSGDSNPLDSL